MVVSSGSIVVGEVSDVVGEVSDVVGEVSDVAGGDVSDVVGCCVSPLVLGPLVLPSLAVSSPPVTHAASPRA